MRQDVTSNVRTDTGLRGCVPSFVRTSEGVVVIDTPQLPLDALAFREEAEEVGPVRYVINTEHHVDHIFGNYYFKGAGPVVHHQAVYDNFMTVYPELDPFAFALEAIPDDARSRELTPTRDEYYRDPNKGDIVFTGDLTLRVGDHTFRLLHTPGHTPGQVAVHVPEERVLFTGDTVFSGCQTWLMTSDLDSWAASLDRLRDLDVDHVVPGHGPVTTIDYLDTQRAVLSEWHSAVARAVAEGWSREETVERVNFADRYPTDVHLEFLMDYIQTLNAGSLYDKITASRGS